MAIYIKGMEMPKYCDECRCICSRWNGNEMIRRCGLMLGEESESTDRDELYELCPLTEVPEPHGRLIDADELKFYGNHIGDEYEDRFHDKQWVHRDEIDNAPTVIEGSE